MSSADTGEKDSHDHKELIRPWSSKMIRKADAAMLGASLTGNLTNVAISFVDYFFVARFLGVDVVAAMALLTPFSLFSSVLHDFLVSGTIAVITRYKSCGENKKAARAFGAILVNQILVYALVYALMLTFARPLLRLLTDDEELIRNGILYFTPSALTITFIEAGLCLERGFRTDGSPKFFAFRGVLTNILNIVLNCFVIFVIKGGVLGISIASCAATLLGFMWSGSYIFSKKCTIRPDLSIVKNLKEMISYIKEEFKIGAVYAADDGLTTLFITVQNKELLTYGGAAALACYGIVSNITNIFKAVANTAQGNFANFCEMLYSDRHIKGVKAVFGYTVQFIAICGMAFSVVCVILSQPIGNLFGITDSMVAELLPMFIGFLSMRITLMYISNIFGSLMLATRHYKLAHNFNIVNNLTITAGLIVGGVLCGTYGVLGFSCAFALAVMIFEIYRLRKTGIVFREKNKDELAVYCYDLMDDSMKGASQKIYELFRNDESLYPASAKASLLTEECNRLLLFQNKDYKKDVMVELHVIKETDGYRITLMDNGVAFNPAGFLKVQDNPEIIDLSAKILVGLSSEATFSRVMDLNISHLHFSLKTDTAGDKGETLA